MKKKLILSLLIIIIIFCILFIKDYYQSLRIKKTLENLTRKNILEEEKIILNFIRERFIDRKGLIISEIKNKKPSTYSLLESYGQLMEYSLLTNDKESFDIFWNEVKKYFVSKKGYLYWRIDRRTFKPDKATALIDSLRVLHSLILAYEKFKNSLYLEEAKKVGEGLLKYNTFQDYLVDCYDENTDSKILKISLFYLDLNKLKKISQYLPEFEKYYLNSKRILEKSIAISNSFFPKELDLVSKNYIYTENINILEQILTLLNLEASTNLEKFEKYISIKIYNCDDPTVYALWSRYYLRKEDLEKARETLSYIKNFQKDNLGIGDLNSMSFYIYTQLETLITLRQLERKK